MHRALDEALLEALRSRTLRERLREAVAPGFTAAQVLERLPSPLREEVRAAHRSPADHVHAALLQLASAARVRTRRVRYGVVLNTKGHRDMVVDVFWRGRSVDGPAANAVRDADGG
jgi:hypothetical protein